MLKLVDVPSKSLQRYEAVVRSGVVNELRELAAPLRGARVAQINATSYGGGVSELLQSLIPMYRDLGVEADWLVVPGEPRFFEITKAIHNSLQGAEFSLTQEDRDAYLSQNQVISDLLIDKYDYIIVHDPQPAPLRVLHGGNGAKWVWRCHIDTSYPNAEAFEFISPFVAEYDATVFTMEVFAPRDLPTRKLVIIPPAIDPLSPKNMALPTDLSRHILEWIGIELDRPLITQVSRFDPWKDPLGVIEVYRRVRQEVPDTQLALLGQMALDDPEGWDVYREIIKAAGDDPDIHVRTNVTGIGNIEVNAFQAESNVVLQKSIREGFGLVVSEAIWKGTPVVAGRAGGIPMQLPDGVGGYVVDNNDDYVEKVVELLSDPWEALEVGSRGRAHVGRNFLITRLLADELRLLGSLK